MALTIEQRRATSFDWQRELSARRAVVAGVAKADIAAAVTAVDQWVEDNASSFNAALPANVRGALTAGQKVELLYRVARRRFEVS